jgi:hypothetical protein
MDTTADSRMPLGDDRDDDRALAAALARLDALDVADRADGYQRLVTDLEGRLQAIDGPARQGSDR